VHFLEAHYFAALIEMPWMPGAATVRCRYVNEQPPRQTSKRIKVLTLFGGSLNIRLKIFNAPL
jgi:hypothetical protein